MRYLETRLTLSVLLLMLCTVIVFADTSIKMQTNLQKEVTGYNLTGTCYKVHEIVTREDVKGLDTCVTIPYEWIQFGSKNRHSSLTIVKMHTVYRSGNRWYFG